LSLIASIGVSACGGSGVQGLFAAGGEPPGTGDRGAAGADIAPAPATGGSGGMRGFTIAGETEKGIGHDGGVRDAGTEASLDAAPTTEAAADREPAADDGGSAVPEGSDAMDAPEAGSPPDCQRLLACCALLVVPRLVAGCMVSASSGSATECQQTAANLPCPDGGP